MTGPRFLVEIDGGGSTVRVAVATPTLNVVAQSEVGRQSQRDRARGSRRVDPGTLRALDVAGVEPRQVAAVGIGVAGAAASHSAEWLREVVRAVTPGALIVPSADYGSRWSARWDGGGVLVLAGTGSLAYGVNRRGRSKLVGGWGYLLGDEGSGGWLGLEGLRAVVRAVDGRGPATMLTDRLLHELGLSDARDLIPWLYRADEPRTPAIARLAGHVLDAAEAGDAVARSLVARAADELAQAANAVIRALNMRRPAIAFAGGLLSADNPLSAALCARLDLPARPVAQYPPVIGAVLLAREHLTSPAPVPHED